MPTSSPCACQIWVYPGSRSTNTRVRTRRRSSGRRRWPLRLTSRAASSRWASSSSAGIPTTDVPSIRAPGIPSCRITDANASGLPPGCSSSTKTTSKPSCRSPSAQLSRTQRLPPWRCLLATAPLTITVVMRGSGRPRSPSLPAAIRADRPVARGPVPRRSTPQRARVRPAHDARSPTAPHRCRRRHPRRS